MGHIHLPPEHLRYLRSIGLGTPHGERPEQGRRRHSRFARIGIALRRLLYSSRQFLKSLGLAATLTGFALAGSVTAEEVSTATSPSISPVRPAMTPPPSPTPNTLSSHEAFSPEESMHTPTATSAARALRRTTATPASSTPSATPTIEPPIGTPDQRDRHLPHALSEERTTKATSIPSPDSPTSRVGVSSSPAPYPSRTPSQSRTYSISSILLAPFVGSLFCALASSALTVVALNRSIARFLRREAARERRCDPAPLAVSAQPSIPDFGACAEISDALKVFLASASPARFPNAPPEEPPSSWGVGIATECGRVRTQNQDFGLAFRVAGCDVVCLADGLGGLPRGREAARIAVAAAAWSAVQTLQAPEAKDLPSLVSEKALLDAAAALVAAGIRDRISGSSDGLRTTLIVLTATPKALGLAYAGDGGGLVVHANGKEETLLQPQKANGQANVVTTSLGPILQGEPQVVLVERQRGDVVLLGTDGVFDRTPSSFPKAVIRALIERGGDAKAVAASVVTDLAGAKDAGGYICDDNLSIAIVGPGRAPVFGPGFWPRVRG